MCRLEHLHYLQWECLRLQLGPARLYTSCMQSKATTVEQYLAELPADRREAIQAVRQVILKYLDRGADGKSGYAEGMQYGMIGFYVPHSVYPAGYHCDPKQPLPFAGLASQKNYMSVYLMSVYGEGPHWMWFHQAWEKTGKKLDMGKCCIRFKKIEDLALDVIGEAILRTPAKKYIEHYEKAILANNKAAAARSAANKNVSGTAKKPVKSKSAAGGPAKMKATKAVTKKATRRK